MSMTRGEILRSNTASWLGPIMSGKSDGKLWPAHDEQCESIWLFQPADGNEWTACHCAERKAEAAKLIHHVKIWKVDGKGESDSANKNMWRGWCRRCDKRVAQYWDFGAALGASIEHQRRARD